MVFNKDTENKSKLTQATEVSMWFHFKVLNILTSIDVIVNRSIDHTWVIVFDLFYME